MIEKQNMKAKRNANLCSKWKKEQEDGKGLLKERQDWKLPFIETSAEMFVIRVVNKFSRFVSLLLFCCGIGNE